MRKLIVLIMVLGFATPAFAVLSAQSPPAWWDNPDSVPAPYYKTLQGNVQGTITGGTGGTQEGLLTFGFQNFQDLERVKYVFLVAEVTTSGGDITVLFPGVLGWSYTPSGGGSAPMDLVADDDANDNHYEFSYGPIDPQPAQETFTLEFTGLDLGETVTMQYDIRSICYENPEIPEPAGLGLFGLALLGIRRRRS